MSNFYINQPSTKRMIFVSPSGDEIELQLRITQTQIMGSVYLNNEPCEVKELEGEE